jgi:hypothetical protein
MRVTATPSSRVIAQGYINGADGSVGAMADVDGDGTLEVFIGRIVSNNVRQASGGGIFKYDVSAGSWQQLTNSAVATACGFFGYFSDVDADGHADLLCPQLPTNGGFTTSPPAVFLNAGDGTLTLTNTMNGAPVWSPSNLIEWGDQALKFADFNGDVRRFPSPSAHSHRQAQ